MAYTLPTRGSSNITMGTSSEVVGPADREAQSWLQRIEENEEKYYKKWNQKFKCSKLEQYYMGQQWEPTGSNYEPYVINLIFSTIEIKLPTLLFQTPVFHVAPKPMGVEYDFEMAIKRALLRQDVLNTIVSDHIQDLPSNLELAILDAFFRFAMVEVGYSADWINNPHADMPILKSDNTPYYYSGTKNVIKQPKKLPKNEQLFVKRVPAERFRVSGLQVGPNLEQCNWCAYWEYVRTEDLVSNPNLDNVNRIKWAGNRSADFVEEDFGPEVMASVRSGDLIKVWKVFDNRSKKKILIADPQQLILKKEDYARLPLFGLRFHPLTKGWLPMPPVSNWKSPQDEYNEAREQGRNHRKRFIRKYLYNDQQLQEEEADKLINGGDGTFVKVNSDVNSAVAPVPNADLGSSAIQALGITKDDFNVISGASSEERLQAERTTATQANIINQKSAIRDSRSRIQVATWLQNIGREVLLQAEENLTAPLWIKMTVPQSELGMAQEEIPYVWHQMSMEDLGQDESDGINFAVSISVDSLSPLQNEQDQQAYLLFLATLQQYPQLAADPILIRETAFRCGYRNEQVITRIQQAAQMMLAQQLQQAQGATGTTGNMMGQQTVQNALPPGVEQIQNQVSNQVPQGGI